MKSTIKRLIYGYCPGISGTFPYFGMKVNFPPGSELFKSVCNNGTYEPATVEILYRLVKDNTYFFDIGANIGLISIPVLMSRPLCHGVAFEPSPNTLPYLKRTAMKSELRNRWTIIGKAVGKCIGELDFHLSIAGFGAYEGFKSTGRVPVSEVVKVPVTTVDCEWEALGRPKVSVIKIDVEGSEKDVLSGAEECINICRPFIYVEWNSTNLKAYNTKPESLMEIAENIKCNIYSIPNIVKISSTSELLLQMNFSENFLLCPV